MPRNDDGFFDEREIIHLCGQAKLSLDDLYELYPHEFIFYIEGYLEDQRSYFEFLNYSLFSSIRQSLNKSKKFKNPFEKSKKLKKVNKLVKNLLKKNTKMKLMQLKKYLIYKSIINIKRESFIYLII